MFGKGLLPAVVAAVFQRRQRISGLARRFPRTLPCISPIYVWGRFWNCQQISGDAPGVPVPCLEFRRALRRCPVPSAALTGFREIGCKTDTPFLCIAAEAGDQRPEQIVGIGEPRAVQLAREVLCNAGHDTTKNQNSGYLRAVDNRRRLGHEDSFLDEWGEGTGTAQGPKDGAVRSTHRSGNFRSRCAPQKPAASGSTGADDAARR